MSLNLSQIISKIITQILNQEIDKDEFYESWNFEWNEFELFDWLESLLEDDGKSESDSDKD